MAETVHRRLEDLLPVFEELHNIDIFSEKEIRSLIKKSTSYEYRLARVQKSKEDFIQYVMYKINLLRLIKARRRKLQYYFKKEKIEYVIISTIHGILSRCTFRWPADLKIWMTHIKFSEHWNKNHQLSKIWSNVLKFHANKPHLWIMAAQFEVKNSNFQNARSLFFRALRHHPKSQQIWLQYFRMEIISISKAKERLNTLIGNDNMSERINSSSNDEAILNGAIAKLVFENAKSTYPHDAKFCCKFIEVALPFLTYVRDLVQNLIDDICEQFPHDEYARSSLAKIYIHPVYYNQDDIETDLAELENMCFSAFEQAIDDVETEDMYDEYVDFILQRIVVNGSQDFANSNMMKFNAVDMNKYHERLNNICIRALSKSKLSTKSCLKFVDFLMQNGTMDHATKILEKIKDGKPTEQVCMKLIELQIANCCTDSMKSIVEKFEEFLSKFDMLSEKTEQRFWHLWLDVCEVISTPEAFTTLLSNAVKVNTKFVPEIKVRFLRWSATYSTIRKTKKLFANNLAKEGQLSSNVYTEMVQILENSADSQKYLNDILSYYDSALKKFGKDEVKLWLDYILFSMKHFTMKVGDIHWRATKALNPDALQQFIEKYSLL